MGSISGEEAAEWDSHDNSNAERIYVAVRARPLNDREIARNDLSDWECINNTTIIFKNSLQERSMLPSAYTFGDVTPSHTSVSFKPRFHHISHDTSFLSDRVFGFNSPTKHVYDEAAKKIALSVLSGINCEYIYTHTFIIYKYGVSSATFWIPAATIFAYGQTGSGKTFTMRGITECAIADIYDYIDKVYIYDMSSILLMNWFVLFGETYDSIATESSCWNSAPWRFTTRQWETCFAMMLLLSDFLTIQRSVFFFNIFSSSHNKFLWLCFSAAERDHSC